MPVIDQAQLGGGDSHPIGFRVTAAGPVTVHTVPAPHPTHSETGMLGAVAIMRPGSSKPVARATAKMTDPFMGARYVATEADVALGGDWTASVFNGSDDAMTWSTTIGGDNVIPIPPLPVHTISLDVTFLNLLFEELTTLASLHVHLQSSGDQSAQSSVTWSPALTHLVKTSGSTFHLDDQPHTVHVPLTGDTFDVTFRIDDLDSDPAYPKLFLEAGTPPKLSATLDFQSATFEALSIAVPNMSVDFIEVTVDIYFDGTVRTGCTASAHLTFNSIDVSNDLADAIAGAIDGKIHGDPTLSSFAIPDVLKGNIDGFFRRLTRLDHAATITGYRSDGVTLWIDYTLPEPQPVHPAGGVVGVHPVGQPVGAVTGSSGGPVTGVTPSEVGSVKAGPGGPHPVIEDK